MPPKSSSVGLTRPRSRRSFAQMPHSEIDTGIDKENMTAYLSAIDSGKRMPNKSSRDKKSRSKSLGPGGLDALQNDTGNRRKVIFWNSIASDTH